MEICQAGSRCGLGGKWRIPCENAAVHAIANPSQEPILLCDKHFQDAIAAGLIADPFISKEEFDRRESERL